MCCFVAPAAVAVATTLVNKKVPKKYHIEWLLLMLWGGVLMLVVDHFATGEVVPTFPFFTKSFSEMLPEIIEVGLPMTMIILTTWVSMIIGTNMAKKRLKLSTEI